MPSRRTGYAIVAVMFSVSVVAFARAEQLKLTRSPVGVVHIQRHFSPTCRPNPNCTSHGALLSFRLRQAARIRLEIVDSNGNVVRTLSPPDGRLRQPSRVATRWNGRTDSGAVAPDGNYRLRVDLLSLGRTIVIPARLILDTVPPVVTLLSRPGALPVRYRTSAPGLTQLRLLHRTAAGKVEVLHVLTGRHGRVRVPAQWQKRGEEMQLSTIDEAGNESAPVSAGTLD